MWTTVVLLGLAVSIEPARIALIALLLTRPRPSRHLLVFLGTGLAMSLSVGFTVLFVFHHTFLGKANFNPALIQVGIGAVAVLLGLLLMSNIPLRQFAKRELVEVPAGAVDSAVVGQDPPPPGRVKRLSTKVRGFAKGESSWFSGSIGAALAMPSVDYMALLALIIASKTPPVEQAAALVTFLLLASWAAVVPLVSFLIVPAKTRIWVQRFNEWIRTRTRKHAGMFVVVVGLILLGVGLHGL